MHTLVSSAEILIITHVRPHSWIMLMTCPANFWEGFTYLKANFVR